MTSSLIYLLAGDLWRTMRADFDRALFEAFEDAENDTNGYLLNKAGRAEGIEPFSLFKGPEARAYRYASHELIEHWAKRPRLTLPAFEAQWLNARGHEDSYDTAWAATNGATR